ncbi:MAG TPA: hypothetical protein VGX28_00505 [Frankiaceae bacterium]|nr:hypothetical protein [Frankiaceae bacterium]
MRRRLALVAAGLGVLGVLAPIRMAGDAAEYGIEDWWYYVALLAVITAVPVAFTIAFAFGGLSQRWVYAAIALFVVVGLVGGWPGLFLGHAAWLVLCLALAAGEPLPPPDRGDDRLYAPIPRDD